MRYLCVLILGVALFACGGEEGDEAEDLAALCAEQQALGNSPGDQGRNHSHLDACAELGPQNVQKKQ